MNQQPIMEIRRITAKDCRVSIAVAFLLAVLLSVRTFHLSSFVVKKEVISYYPNLEAKKWSPAMLQASRSRIKTHTGRSEAQTPPQQQLQVVGESLARVKQIIVTEDLSQMDDDEKSFEGEIMVDLFSTGWRELASLFWSHQFRGIFLYRRSQIDRV